MDEYLPIFDQLEHTKSDIHFWVSTNHSYNQLSPLGALLEVEVTRGWQQISKSQGSDTGGDSCFSITQTGGFFVFARIASSFILRISSSVTVAKRAAILKISSWDGYPRIYRV